MAVPALTTRLAAVNVMLRSINEAPVNSLTPPYTDDVGFCLDTLDEVQKETLSKGWTFNTECDIELVLDGDSKFPIPVDVTSIVLDPRYQRCNLDLVPREDAGVLKLYNKARGQHTFVLPAGLRGTFIYLFDFEFLPECFRKYITIRAARTFQARLMGAPATAFSQLEEVQAQYTLRSYEMDKQVPSVFNNWSAARVIRRGYPDTWGHSAGGGSILGRY